MTPDRRTLLAIFSLAFGVRVLYAVTIGADPDVIPRRLTQDYHTAVAIASGAGWLGTPFSPSAPGYILSLAAVFKILGAKPWIGLLFNAFLGATTALFVYRIGEKRLGRGVGILAAVWFALYVQHLHMTSIFTRYTMTTLGWVWIFYIATKRFEKMRSSVWAGLVYAALVHVEPMFIVLLPVFFVGFIAYATHHRLLSVQFAFVFFLVVVLACVPWTVRNALVYKEPIPVALEATRYTGPFTELLVASETALPRTAAAERSSPGFIHNTVEFWRVVRLSGADEDASRGVRATRPWSLRHNLISLLQYGLLLPFFAVGVVIGVRRRNRAAIVLAAGVLAYWLVRAFVGGHGPYRYPAEPLIILLAFYGAVSLYTGRAARRAAAEPQQQAASG